MSSAETEGIFDDETAITEITFLPDGRLCLFGASREIIELLDQLQLGDAFLNERLAAIRGLAHPADSCSTSIST